MVRISSKDISVVVQGPIDSQFTPECINSIRKCLPNAEIILSTWKGENLNTLEVEKVIYNVDPKGVPDDPAGNRMLNINRWIVSSRNGVKAASNKYVLKCRTDSYLENCNFLKYWDSYSKREKVHSIAEHKIIIPSPYTLRFIGDGEKKIYTPFHISDWYCFGLKCDIEEFVSCPLIKDLKSFARYFEDKLYKIPNYASWWIKDWYRKYAPEQYIGLNYAKKLYPDLEIKDALESGAYKNKLWNHFLLNNFIVLDPNQAGIYLSKYMDFSKKIYILDDFLWKGMYRNHIYVKLYEKIFHNNLGISSGVYIELQHKLFQVKKGIIQIIQLNHLIDKVKNRFYLIKDRIRNNDIARMAWIGFFKMQKAETVINEIYKRYGVRKYIFICPYSGIGDSFIVGNYLQRKNMQDSIILVVGKANEKVLHCMGINNVVVVEKNTLELLQIYKRVTEDNNVIILHYSSDFEFANTRYNFAGYKNLKFLDFYDYMVFKEKEPQLLYPIKSKRKNMNFASKFPELEKGNTVIMAPYASSVPSLDIKEWNYIVQSLLKKGYKVVTNCGSLSEKPLNGTDAVSIDFDEIHDFADWCGYFIGVRSGLCDLICMSSCRKIIFHPDSQKYLYGDHRSFFGLNDPLRNIIAEDYTFSNNNKALLRSIINTF